MATKVEFIGKLIREGEAILIDGVNPWAYDWQKAGSSSFLGSHPSYPGKRHQVTCYRITADGRTVSFWAGVVSDGLWAFYLSSSAN